MLWVSNDKMLRVTARTWGVGIFVGGNPPRVGYTLSALGSTKIMWGGNQQCGGELLPS